MPCRLFMDRAVERGMDRREATPIPHVGIDEKSFGKGHDYITVLTDVDGSRVLDVVPERTQAAAEAVLQTGASRTLRAAWVCVNKWGLNFVMGKRVEV